MLGLRQWWVLARTFRKPSLIPKMIGTSIIRGVEYLVQFLRLQNPFGPELCLRANSPSMMWQNDKRSGRSFLYCVTTKLCLSPLVLTFCTIVKLSIKKTVYDPRWHLNVHLTIFINWLSYISFVLFKIRSCRWSLIKLLWKHLLMKFV